MFMMNFRRSCEENSQKSLTFEFFDFALKAQVHLEAWDRRAELQCLSSALCTFDDNGCQNRALAALPGHRISWKPDGESRSMNESAARRRFGRNERRFVYQYDEAQKVRVGTLPLSSSPLVNFHDLNSSPHSTISQLKTKIGALHLSLWVL